MRYITLITVLFVLTACGGGGGGINNLLGDNATPLEQVYVLKRQYEFLIDRTIEYAELPRCGTAAVLSCSSQGVVDAALSVIEQANESLTVAEELAQANDGGAEAQIVLAREMLQRIANMLPVEN